MIVYLSNGIVSRTKPKFDFYGNYRILHVVAFLKRPVLPRHFSVHTQKSVQMWTLLQRVNISGSSRNKHIQCRSNFSRLVDKEMFY